jgi:hypothetical protein
MKYNLTYLNATENAFLGLYFEVDNASSHILSYGLLALLFVVSFYIFIRRTQDQLKSGISAMHIVTIVSLLIYFMGKTNSVDTLSDIFMFGWLILYSSMVGVAYYLRTEKN